MDGLVILIDMNSARVISTIIHVPRSCCRSVNEESSTKCHHPPAPVIWLEGDAVSELGYSSQSLLPRLGIFERRGWWAPDLS